MSELTKHFICYSFKHYPIEEIHFGYAEYFKQTFVLIMKKIFVKIISIRK